MWNQLSKKIIRFETKISYIVFAKTLSKYVTIFYKVTNRFPAIILLISILKNTT